MPYEIIKLKNDLDINWVINIFTRDLGRYTFQLKQCKAPPFFESLSFQFDGEANCQSSCIVNFPFLISQTLIGTFIFSNGKRVTIIFALNCPLGK